MNRKSLFFLTSVFLTFVLITTSHAFFKNDVDKAKDFMKVDMYPQAIELLNKRINEKPTDAEAHFQLGLCYMSTGDFRKADKRFSSGVKLEPDYKGKIGREFKQAGIDALIDGKTGKAKTLFLTAVKYQPDLQDGIATYAFGKGKASFDHGRYRTADERFSVVVALDITLHQEICDMFFEAGEAADNNSCVDLYKRAKGYCSTHNKEMGQRFVKLAKADGISDAQKQKYKKEAGLYLSKAEMNEAFPPDYKDL